MEQPSLNKTLAFLHKVIITIMIFSSPNVVFSQESFSFPDSNAIWSEIYYPPINNDGIPPAEFHQFGIFSEDTVIDGLEYKRLYHTRELDFYYKTSEPIGGIRKDSTGKVFYNGKILYGAGTTRDTLDNEYLIYDFSLTQKDTMILDIWFLPFDLLVIDTVYQINFGGYNQKFYEFEIYVESNWIEGVGNTRGLLFPHGDYFTNGIYNELVCFTMNNQLLFKKYDAPTCNPLTGVQEINTLEKEIVHLYPNPAAYYTFLKFPLGDYKLTIYDVNGQMVYQKQIINADLHKITLENFSNGIYSYLLCNNKHTFSGKFIINK